MLCADGARVNETRVVENIERSKPLMRDPIHTRPAGEENRKRLYPFAAASIVGISFWFIVGYPFGNHNESFVIVPRLLEMSFGEVLHETVFPVANYRPLGLAVAWAGVHANDGKTYGVQIFNVIAAALGWLLLFAAVREKHVFALAAAIVGGTLFSGYIYLFHLHGVFYSPLLMLIAAFFFLFENELTPMKALAAVSATVVVAFFHPYALLLLLAALSGSLFDRRSVASRGEIARILIGLTIAVVLLWVLVVKSRQGGVLTVSEMIQGLLVSYRMTEVHPLLSILSILLAIGAVWSIPVGRRGKASLLLSVLGVSVLAWSTGLPLLIVWVAASALKLLFLRKAWAAALIGMTALLPAPAATGSPTYAVFVLFACTAALAYRWDDAERFFRALPPSLVTAMVMASVVLAFLVRLGLSLPVLHVASDKILAEKEKTYQMEEVVRWFVHSDFRGGELRLHRPGTNPRESDDTIDRAYRPPTSQDYLWAYVRASMRDNTSTNPALQVVVTFGGQQLDDGWRCVHQLAGKYAGASQVWVRR